MIGPGSGSAEHEFGDDGTRRCRRGFAVPAIASAGVRRSLFHARVADSGGLITGAVRPCCYLAMLPNRGRHRLDTLPIAASRGGRAAHPKFGLPYLHAARIIWVAPPLRFWRGETKRGPPRREASRQSPEIPRLLT